jgi:hypothetical protein
MTTAGVKPDNLLKALQQMDKFREMETIHRHIKAGNLCLSVITNHKTYAVAQHLGDDGLVGIRTLILEELRAQMRTQLAYCAELGIDTSELAVPEADADALADLAHELQYWTKAADEPAPDAKAELVALLGELDRGLFPYLKPEHDPEPGRRELHQKLRDALAKWDS